MPAGESVLFVDPGEIPAAEDVAKLGQAVAALRQRPYELMVHFAAYTGLRWDELAALTAFQIGQEARTVAMDRKVIEVRGRMYVEAPKNRKRRQTVYPSLTPQGWPLGEMVAARIAAVSEEQAAGANPPGLTFPAPRGGYWRSSNFRRRVLESGYQAAGWRAADGAGQWTWHSLRHVFCTATRTAAPAWKPRNYPAAGSPSASLPTPPAQPSSWNQTRSGPSSKAPRPARPTTS